jgi:hypothetical protein
LTFGGSDNGARSILPIAFLLDPVHGNEAPGRRPIEVSPGSVAHCATIFHQMNSQFQPPLQSASKPLPIDPLRQRRLELTASPGSF